MSASSLFDPGLQPASMPASGLRVTRVGGRYQKIRACLQGYLSGIMVESCIKQALARRGMTSPRSAADLEWLVEEIMVGLRLFVSADRLPELMVELSELLGEEW